jgi:hypothetical protein
MRPLISLILLSLAPTVGTIALLAVPSAASAAMSDDTYSVRTEDWGPGEGGGTEGGDWGDLGSDYLRDSGIQDIRDNFDRWLELGHRPYTPPVEPQIPTAIDNPTWAPGESMWEYPGECDEWDIIDDSWVFENWGCG